MASEQEPFLAVTEEEKVSFTKSEAQCLRRSSLRWRLCTSFLLAQMALLALYTIGTVWIINLHDSEALSYSCG